MDDREIKDFIKDVAAVMRQLVKEATSPIIARLDALESQANVGQAKGAM